MKIRIPSFIRPYASKILVTVIVSGGAWLGSKLGTDPIISSGAAERIADIAIGWLVLSGGHTAISAKVNPTNSATPQLAETVPSEVVPKSEGTVVAPATPGGI